MCEKAKRKSVIALTLMTLLMAGCGAGTEPEELQQELPYLRLTVQLDEGSEPRYLVNEFSEEAFTTVYIRDVGQVDIEINGETMQLEDALEQQRISVAEISVFARLDAQKGFCQETYETDKGLTNFIYNYGDYEVTVCNDVYETPAKGDYRIERIGITPTGFTGYGRYGYYRDPEDGWVIDREDWGLSFTCTEVTATSATIQCTQKGGQLIGQLLLDGYDMGKDEGMPDRLTDSSDLPAANVTLNMSGETTFTLDWTEEYGQLPSGSYWINLSIIDQFEKDQVHPLMQDYHDWQYYTVNIQIP